jgi:hypothetical protein
MAYDIGTCGRHPYTLSVDVLISVPDRFRRHQPCARLPAELRISGPRRNPDHTIDIDRAYRSSRRSPPDLDPGCLEPGPARSPQPVSRSGGDRAQPSDRAPKCHNSQTARLQIAQIQREINRIFGLGGD